MKRYYVHFKVGFFCVATASSFFERGNMLVFCINSGSAAEFFIKSVDYVEQVPLFDQPFKVWG